MKDIYARIDSDIITLMPDWVSFLVGINDTPELDCSRVGLDSDEYEDVYRRMLKEISASLPNTHFILCEPFALAGTNETERISYRRKYVEKLAARVKKIATDMECIWVLLQQVFDEATNVREPEYWVWDGIHPTENGHGLIAREWIKAAGTAL